MNRIVIVVILMGIVVSCQVPDEDQSASKFLINPENEEVFKFSEYYGVLNYVKLEMDSLNPIGNIRQLIEFDDSYFITDDVTKKVFCYSTDGDFRFIIGREGRGPGEYQSIRSISINPQDSLLIVYDIVSESLMQYSIIDGSFKSFLRLRCMPLDVIYVDKGEIALFMNYYAHPKQEKMKMPMNLVYTNDGSKITNGFLPFDPSLKFPSYGPQIFSSVGDQTFLMPMFDNDVYLLSSENCAKFISLSFGQYDFHQDLFDGLQSSSERLQKLYNSERVFGKSSFYNYDKYYSFRYTWKGINYETYINKESKEVKVHKAKRNDINSYPAGVHVSSGPNVMYYAIEPYGFIKTREMLFSASQNDSLNFLERTRSKLLYERIDSLFTNLSENDNPIIGIYEFK